MSIGKFIVMWQWSLSSADEFFLLFDDFRKLSIAYPLSKLSIDLEKGTSMIMHMP